MVKFVLPEKKISFTNSAPGEKLGLLRSSAGYAVGPDWPTPSLSLANDLVSLTNAYRVSQGLHELIVLQSLVTCAVWKSMDMAKFQYMDHDQPPGSLLGTPSGSSVYDRFNAFGFGNAAWGENIGYGFTTAQSLLDAFLSEGPGGGHYENVRGGWTHIACGVVQASNGLIFWTQDFTIASTPPPPPPPLPTKIKVGQVWSLNSRPKTHVAVEALVGTTKVTIKNVVTSVERTILRSSLRTGYTLVG